MAAQTQVRNQGFGDVRRPMLGNGMGNGNVISLDENRPERLFELILRLLSRVDKPTLLEDILVSLGSFWDTGVGALLLVDGTDGGSRVAATMGLSTHFCHLLDGAPGAALLSYTLSERQPKTIEELKGHPLHRWIAEMVTPEGHQNGCFLPLVTPTGAEVGALALYFPEKRYTSPQDLQHLTLLGPLVAQLIYTGRAHSAMKSMATRFRARAQKLNGMTEECMSLSRELDQATLLRRAVRLAATWMAEGCAVDLLGPGKQIVKSEGACRISAHDCGGFCSTPSLRARHEVMLHLLRTRAPVIVRDASPAQLDIPDAASSPERWDSGSTTVLVLHLPLIVSGQVAGAMTFVRQQPRGVEEEESILLATQIARHTAYALEHLQLLRTLGSPLEA
jgi:GAF domain-containing protein